MMETNILKFFKNGSQGLPEFSAAMALIIVSATTKQTMASLLPNIQTIDHGLATGVNPVWLQLLVRTEAKRLVPIGQMHHFGPVWGAQPVLAASI